MKKIILTAVLMLAALSGFAQTGKSLYNKYSGKKDVSAVYISPLMFKLIGKLPELDAADDDVNITPFVKSLEGFYLIESENVAINEELKADVGRMIASKAFELLLEAKDDGETVRIYTCSNGDFITSFVMLSCESDECTFLCVDGQILKDEFDKAILNSKN